MKKLILFLLVFIFFFTSFVFIRAKECNEGDPTLQQICLDINELEKALEMSKAATQPLESELNKLETQIKRIQAAINVANQKIKSLEEDIFNREIELAYQQEVLAARVRSLYKKNRQYSPLLIFLVSSSANDLFRELSYRQTTTQEDKRIIIDVSQDLITLKNDKEKLEENKIALAASQKNLDQQAEFFRTEVAKARTYQAQVSSKIAELTAKQQALLAEKFASVPIPLLAYTSLRGCSSDIGKDSGFSPRFGFFSFGVPNKTGLNQYGAKGRAETGQSYEQILNAYYDNFQIVDYGTGFNIIVNGYNRTYNQTFNNVTMNIENYLKHLYEVPSDWHPEALKAQAIAARSYALYITKNGQNTIEPNENNQVVKLEENADSWKNAVDATKGKVMTYSGSPIGAWYSSTHGGFVLKSGEIGWNDTAWTKHAVDAGSANSLNDLLNSAYDKSSPWFYCDWGYRKEYNNTAWLKEEEVVDIVNAYILWQIDNNTISHLSQTDKSIPDTWSTEKVRQEISSRGGNYISSINSISVDWDGSGISKTIRVNGKSFDAQKFKNMFNLRAPGNIQIKPACQPDSALNCSKMYGLYNVVKE